MGHHRQLGQVVGRDKSGWLLFIALSLVAGLGHAASAQTPDPAPPPAPSLKGAAAWQKLVGNTAIAQAKSGAYTEFYAADGGLIHVDADGKSTGRWSLDGDTVCFDFPEEDDRSCVAVEINGDNGVFTDEDGARDTFTVASGNAKNL